MLSPYLRSSLRSDNRPDCHCPLRAPHHRSHQNQTGINRRESRFPYTELPRFPYRQLMQIVVYYVGEYQCALPIPSILLRYRLTKLVLYDTITIGELFGHSCILVCAEKAFLTLAVSRYSPNGCEVDFTLQTCHGLGNISLTSSQKPTTHQTPDQLSPQITLT